MGFATVTFDTSDVELIPLDEAEDAVAAMRDAGLTVEYSGLLGAADAPAEPKSELIGMGVAVVVLVLAFGSLVAMSLPLGVALISLLVGTGTIGLISGQVPIPSAATLVGSMLGLGVGIDYALFVLARHRENIGTDVGLHDSVGRANATAGLSVLFAGSTVVLAIAGLQLAGVPMIAAMGWTSALMVAVTMVAALTLLPALLGLSGKRIDSLRVVRPGPATGAGPRGRAGGPTTWPITPSATSSPRSRCSDWSPPPRPRCASASPTTATSARRAPCAGPTTCSPRASGPASTARSRW